MRSLRGLAMGDAFGETWFHIRSDRVGQAIADRDVSAGPWSWTDDTAMAIPLVRHLFRHDRIDPDELALAYAHTYTADRDRGYGPAMHRVLHGIADGEPWRDITVAQFGGRGSWGNGAAMRVAPLGVHYADDLAVVAAEAAVQAVVTHANPEAVAGSVAVAIAAALIFNGVRGPDVLRAAADAVPDTEVGNRLRRTVSFRADSDPMHVAAMVGCGVEIAAFDTVPYALWCAVHHVGDLEEALWITVTPGGDSDTTAAIVGGVLGAVSPLPVDWIDNVEPIYVEEPANPTARDSR